MTVTLSTSTLIANGIQPQFIEASMPLEAGRCIRKNSLGKAEYASNASLLRSDIIGVTTSKAYASGQWVSYAKPGDDLTTSGLTKGVSYYLDHGTDEVQTITITGTPTGGTFTLTFGGQTTAPIAYNASAATVQAALELLTSIGSGNVLGGGGPLPGVAVTITFKNALGAFDQALMTANSSGLTGGSSPTVTPTETTPGASTGNLCLFADLVTGNVVTVVGAADSTTNLSLLPNPLAATI